MLKNNYHTHMKYCNHAKGDVKEYIEKAIELGFSELGMSDHAPTPDGALTPEELFDNKAYRYMTKNMIILYLNQIREQQTLNQDKIKIYSGFETEYIEGYIDHYKWLKSQVDYLNLGMHFFKDKSGKIKNSYRNIDYTNVLDYASSIVKGIETGLYKCAVHPDLYMYNYKDKSGNKTFDDNAKLAAKMILDAAVKNNIYVEINCNGIGWDPKWLDNEKLWPYPNRDFWEFAKEYKNLKILIGADAHDPERLGSKNIEKVFDFAKSIGLKIEEKMVI